MKERQATHRPSSRKRPIILALTGTVAATLTACSVHEVAEFLLKDDPPPHPGRESVAGAHLVYDRDREGDWSATRKYSKAQEKQLEEYREYRREHDDD